MEEKTGKKRGGKKREKTDGNSGHYVIASSRTPTAGTPHARAKSPNLSMGILKPRGALMFKKCLNFELLSDLIQK